MRRFRIVYSVLTGSEPARINYFVYNVDAKNHLDAITDFRVHYPGVVMESVTDVLADRIVWDGRPAKLMHQNLEHNAVVLDFRKKEKE